MAPSALELVLNGARHAVDATHGNLSLLEWMRTQAHVKSAKLSCGEGGCGACAVVVEAVDPATGQTTVRSANSCLLPVFAVHGCTVLTAEGLPKNAEGVNPVAERLAGFHASQCGFCTPGMAVACHTALAKAAACGKPAPSSTEMRDALDGNLCRCTGYRPIIAACTSFSPGVDIEDLGSACALASLPAPAPLVVHEATPPPSSPELAELTMAGGQKLLVPHSLPQLVQAVSSTVSSGAGSFRLVAGNTAHGVYKDWPTEDVLISIMQVPELRQLGLNTTTAPDAAPVLRIGAAVSLASVLDQLLTWADGPADGVAAAGAAVWHEVAAHLKRVAGSHVRNSATLVGNLVLSRRRGLPSDVATLLLAAGASVEVLDASSPGAQPTVLTLEQFLTTTTPAADGGQRTNLDASGLVVTAALLPVPQVGSRFWSNRVATRHANAVSSINAAGFRSPSGDMTFVLAMDLSSVPGQHNWRVARCAQVEASLQSGPTSAAALPALRALAQDLDATFGLPGGASSPEHGDFLRSVAEGFLLQAMSALLGAGALGISEPRSVLQAASEADHLSGHPTPPSSGEEDSPRADACAGSSVGPPPAKLSPPAVSRGTQDLPEPDPKYAPLMKGLPKESAKIQAQGTAQYSDDVPLQPGALFAALVTSTVAKGTVKGIDLTAASKVPGFARFVGPKDIPGKHPSPFDEPIFAESIGYHGQPVGLVLADSYQAAQRAAQLVVVEVEAPDTPAIITVEDALSKGSVWDLKIFAPMMQSGQAPGSVVAGAEDVADHVAAAPLKLIKQKLHVPSQAHMYMEPQTAVAELDEDGCVRVHISTQSTDSAIVAVASLLNLTHNKVEIKCRRAGGAFGGKMKHPDRFAGAAAVAAVAAGKQVRLAVNRNVDMAMIGGRCQIDVTYSVGFDQQGKILALDLEHVLQGGWYPGLSWLDATGMQSTADNVYEVPSMRAQYQLTKCNLPQRSAVRAPGDFPAVLIMESVVEHVASHLGLDPTLVRERNMQQAKPDESHMTNSIGKVMGATAQYSLPRIWQELKTKVDWEARLAAVHDFNARNTWRKRGIAIMPCRYPLFASKRNALVHVYGDGSVRVAHPGCEIGQGLTVKVLQTAAHELSQILPEAQRPIPLDMFRTADVSSYTLPHASLTAGSVTSDAACVAVRAACAQLVERLRPLTKDLGDAFTWDQVLKKAFVMPGFPPMVPLTAMGESTVANDFLVPPPPGSFQTMCTYGAGVAEVEVDVLTGDRQVLSVDILFDCGRTINPAVDLGQIEGAFVFGMGLVLSEHVEADPTTGACLTNSTWSYKVPGALCVPHKLNVAMLKDSPLFFKGSLGGKAIGEPPLLLATSVMAALEAATRAAAHQVFGVPQQELGLRLRLPATPQNVKLACGTQPLAKLPALQPPASQSAGTHAI